MLSTTPIQPLSRKYLSEDFKIENWEVLQPYFEELATRPLDSLSALHRWLQDLSELESVIQEEGSWRQIQLTRNTSDARLRESFEYFITQIEPNIKPYAFKLNQKLLDCPFVDLLDEAQFMPYIRAVRN